MRTKLFTTILALAMTNCLIASVQATAQQIDQLTLNEIDAHIVWSLNDNGIPFQDCNPGHLACCNALIPPLPRSATASQAVQLAKLGLCPQAVPLIVATQCHNPGAMYVLINNSATTCSELAKH